MSKKIEENAININKVDQRVDAALTTEVDNLSTNATNAVNYQAQAFGDLHTASN
jgi:hypothetical protein